jgi:hypothetical protein
MWVSQHKVFVSKPRTIEELKQKIMKDFTAISEQMTYRGDGKSSRKFGAVFKKWSGTSE